MLKRLILPLFGFAFLALPALAVEEDKADLVLEKAVDDVIRPGYRNFAETSSSLETALSTLCTTPSEPNAQAAKAAFDAALKSWGMVEIIRSGPALEDNRFERVLYYPDRKGIALKQIQQILSKKEASAEKVETLRQKSVGVQGLGALEYVLYGTGSETLLAEPDGHRCLYGQAIAANLKAIAGELSAAWEKPGGIGDQWKHPGPDNPVFRDDREAVTEMLGIMVHGVEMVREQRIEAFYPEGNPKAALLRRAGKTWDMLGANLTGLSIFWKKAHMETLLKEDQRSVASSIGFVMKSMIRVTGTVTPDIEKAVSDKDEKAKLDFLLLNSKDLISRLSEDYGKALGLGAGFSFSDGD